jgi:DNA invertase Pin-like site-specific DNA recombinase
MFIRAYLRASTDSQDAARAKESLIAFTHSKDQKIASFYQENESGRKLKRPQLMKLLEEASSGDVILVESIDRLTRLTSSEWDTLKLMIQQKGLQITSLDLPTSHTALEVSDRDALSEGILKAVNNMLIDILATMACKDYEQRRQRSAQGIEKAKANGLYKGRPENIERNTAIGKMLESGSPYTEIQKATGASRATIAKIKSRLI